MPWGGATVMVSIHGARIIWLALAMFFGFFLGLQLLLLAGDPFPQAVPYLSFEIWEPPWSDLAARLCSQQPLNPNCWAPEASSRVVVVPRLSWKISRPCRELDISVKRSSPVVLMSGERERRDSASASGGSASNHAEASRRDSNGVLSSHPYTFLPDFLCNLNS